MKLLVVGASGLVGSYVYEEARLRGHNVIGTYRNFKIDGLHRLDLDNPSDTLAMIEDFKPNWVVHAAGWTWVDGCESDPERAFRENCEQPAQLARFCKKTGTRFAYFSTTYVFDGTNGPYSENDAPNPINVYGKSKWAAEQQIQALLDGQALVPRVICVWGREHQKKNFVYQVIKAVRENQSITLPSDQIGNPSWAGDIAWWLLELISSDERGCWNLAGSGENQSRVGWFNSIALALKRAGVTSAFPNIKIMPTSLIGQVAPRPLHAGARTNKIAKRYPRTQRSPEDLSELGIFPL